MILVKDRFIFLCTPRAASRSIAHDLKTHCGGRVLNSAHHAHSGEMSILREYDEPVVAMIRDPYSYMMARWAYFKRSEPHWRQRSWKDFFRFYKPDLANHFGDRIATYHAYVDHYYTFARGPRSFFDNIGFPGVTLSHVGRVHTGCRIPVDLMEQEWKDDIDERFKEDVELYRKVASAPPYKLTTGTS